ncbi:MAG: hypothetical protein Q7T54_05910 [Candidatus Levybacteria bacterium]|nr:hypothetical protein [Candidatus Levybacteria bacterium]
MRKRKKLSRGGIWPPLLFIGLLLSASYVLSTTLDLKSATDTTESYIIQKETNYSQKENVQLGTLDLVQNTPTPVVPTPAADVCNHDMFKKSDPLKCFCTGAWLIHCEGDVCKEINYSKSGAGTSYTCKEVDAAGWCKLFAKEGDGWYCIGKPVIYLYPEVPTLVNVAVATEGEVFVSDPPITYTTTDMTKGGWKNVLALPGGTLLHQGKTYRELFYESITKDVKRPQKGIVIEKTTLEKDLLTFITQLGLTKNDEQQEFLDWWVPQLKNLSSEKLFVSILEKDEKKRLDQVFINPQPDTFIEFIVYFSPLAENETVEPLILPPTPKRIGFTAIEWGGVIGD